MERVQLVLHSKTSTLRAYIPKTLFDTVRKRAKREGMPYKRYIRLILERAVAKPKWAKAKAG